MTPSISTSADASVPAHASVPVEGRAPSTPSPAHAGDLSRLGSGERNASEMQAPCGPSAGDGASQRRGEGAIRSSSIIPSQLSIINSSSSAPSLYDYPAPFQDEVRDRERIMLDISRADNKRAVITVTAALGRPGLSEQNLYRMHAKWEASGRDWRTLMNKREWPELWERSEREAKLPVAFINWVAGQFLGNQKNSRPAWRAILRRWEKWLAGDESAAIPGYASCPPVGSGRAFPRCPDGWSYQNLMRRAQPPKDERAIARVGTVSAKSLLPYVPGTRVGARWMEFCFWDDVDQDRKVVSKFSLTPDRILQLGGLEYSSGLYFESFGLRPFIENDEKKREGLKRRDFLAVIAATLDRYGFPADYDSYHIVERGTATMSAAEARVLYDVSGGRIHVCYTSMNGEFIHAWNEDSKGNSSGKASLESWHHLYHNEMGCLTGQMGKDRDHSPALMKSQERESTNLIKLGTILPAELRARLRTPHPTMEEAFFQSLTAVKQINERMDHKLDGFDNVSIWRVPGTTDWHTEAELADANPDIVNMLQWDYRVETPMERAARLSQGVRMIRLPANIWPRFFEDSHTLAKVERSWIAIGPQGREMFFGFDDPENQPVPNGTEVLVYHAPINPTKVYVTANGRFVGEWPRLYRCPRGREHSKQLSQAIKRKQSYLNVAAGRVQTKMAESIQREEQRINSNMEVLAEAGIIPAAIDAPSDSEGRAGTPLHAASGTCEDSGSGSGIVHSPLSTVHCAPGASALQEIGRRMETAKQAAKIDPIKSILASRDADEKSPVPHDEDWAK